MIAVSNTSPLNYLVLIELAQVLPELFNQILIPKAVWEELQSAAAPDPIKRFLKSEPKWLETRTVAHIDPSLRHLDDGEGEAIALALEVSANLVLLDERKGRRTARECGLMVSGTLGVIALGAKRGLLNKPDALRRLRRTNFRALSKLIRHVESTD